MIRLTHRGIFVLAVLTVLIVYYAFTGPAISVVIASASMPLIFYVVKTVRELRTLNIVDYRVDVPRNIILGEEFQITTDIVLSKATPATPRVTHVIEPGNIVTLNRQEISTEDNAISIQLTFKPQHIGSVRIRKLTIRFITCLGLVEKLFDINIEKELNITPRTYIVAHAIIHGLGLLLGSGLVSFPKPARTGLEYLQSREFREGDDTRFIDWKATARTGVLHVKEFEELRFGKDLIVLRFSSCKDVNLLDNIAVASMLLIYTLVKQGFGLTLLVCTTHGQYLINVEGEQSLNDVIRKLVALFTLELLSLNRVYRESLQEFQNYFKDVKRVVYSIMYVTSPLEPWWIIHNILEPVDRGIRKVIVMPYVHQEDVIVREFVEINVRNLRRLVYFTVLGNVEDCVRRTVSTYV